MPDIPDRHASPLARAADARLLRAMSLDALRGFEAAGRHLSITRAAQELCLTQPAVSKQVAAVEDAVGAPVFVRTGRGLRLTAAGAHLHAGVQRALHELQAALAPFAPRPSTAGARTVVSVTTTPSFASLWLAPRLAALRASAPDIDVRVDASEAAVDLAARGVDLAVRLAAPAARAADAPPSRDGDVWLEETLVLVAAPAVAARIRSPRDLAGVPALAFAHAIQRWPGLSWPCWRTWLGIAASAPVPQFEFTQYEHVVSAAREGAGIAIGRLPLVRSCLADGSLRVVLPHARRPGPGYRLIAAPGADRPEVQRVRAWLCAEMGNCSPAADRTRAGRGSGLQA
jgi:DNA-binding transcriptional LysR family regulator